MASVATSSVENITQQFLWKCLVNIYEHKMQKFVNSVKMIVISGQIISDSRRAGWYDFVLF